jgi:hypothetical protein
MLMLQPRLVRFAGMTLENVTHVTLSREPAREVVEWSDGGPYAVFADVPEQRVVAVIRQELVREDWGDVRPGTMGTLTIVTAPAGADGRRRRLTATAVVLASASDVRGGSSDGRAPRAERSVRLVLVSPDGAADPVAMTDAGAEP